MKPQRLLCVIEDQKIINDGKIPERANHNVNLWKRAMRKPQAHLLSGSQFLILRNTTEWNAFFGRRLQVG